MELELVITGLSLSAYTHHGLCHSYIDDGGGTDLHNTLNPGSQLKIHALAVAEPTELCTQIIHATEAGTDLGDLLDSSLLTLC